uniref:Glutamate--cysteine ligase n=1 Tax=Chrysotila carterae TaxID=13221 RepID=A0A7S4B8C5_CHRCT
MGFLEEGVPLNWADSLAVIKYVREHGIQQFLSMFNRVRTIENDDLLWGDEVEFAVAVLDEQAGTVKISLRGAELLTELRAKEGQSHPESGRYETCHWAPEFGSWMVEGTPGGPYSGFAADLLRVERNMRIRRARLIAALRPGEICPTLPCFPMMGCGDFTVPAAAPNGDKMRSLFIPDACINPHPRFGTLVQNIRQRRGSKVDIRVPRFKDKNTPQGTPAGCPAPSTLEEALKMDEVYMDAMAFGMGCCCLQVTFQGRDIAESRHLYDHLAVLSPILLALTAATPIARGVLLDTDVRWSIIAQSVDDRTDAERRVPNAATVPNEQMAGNGTRPLPKSRYDSISTYICHHQHGRNKESSTNAYNDIEAPIDQEAFETLCKGGVDEVLARHIAHLFVRDPLVVFEGRIEFDDDEATDHFENLQSTNWQTVRWKPPPAGAPLSGEKHIGWRTEFRSMEVQLTDFENAAFTVFVVLISRVILYFDLNLYMPLSKVDENMRRAHSRDAINTEKFWFRQTIMPPDSRRSSFTADGEHRPTCCGDLTLQECTVHEILMGKGDFRGLVPLVMAYLDMIDTDTGTLNQVSNYLQFICARASGELMSPAAWMRRFVMRHPAYKHDSVVPQRVAADLMATCHRIGAGLEKVPELHGSFHIAPVLSKDAYAKPLRSGDLFSPHKKNTDELIMMEQLRMSLLTKRRQLQEKEKKMKKDIEDLAAEMRHVDAQLAMLSAR